MDKIEVTLVPRNQSVADLIELYRLKLLTYEQLYKEVADMGYSTVSLYEAVRHLR